jgi:hypothetical protein
MMTAYRDAIRMVGGEHPAEARVFVPDVIQQSGVFGAARVVECPNAQRLDEAGLIGRAMSASYAPKDGEKGRILIARLREIFSEFREADGFATLRYTTRIWLAEGL